MYECMGVWVYILDIKDMSEILKWTMRKIEFNSRVSGSDFESIGNGLTPLEDRSNEEGIIIKLKGLGISFIGKGYECMGVWVYILDIKDMS